MKSEHSYTLLNDPTDNVCLSVDLGFGCGFSRVRADEYLHTAGLGAAERHSGVRSGETGDAPSFGWAGN